MYVSGNLFMYYQKGNPRAVVAPDVFVVLGADNADRSTYRLWEEPKGPDFVLEITSRSTRREDQVSKRELYRSLRVQEYWQFDPTHDYLEPPLQGLELVAGEYRPLPARELSDGTPGILPKKPGRGSGRSPASRAKPRPAKRPKRAWQSSKPGCVRPAVAIRQADSPARRQSYDTLSLPDVYAVLAYCLTHRERIDDYMRRCDAEDGVCTRRWVPGASQGSFRSWCARTSSIRADDLISGCRR